MSNDGDTSSLDTFCDEALVQWATSKCLRREGRTQDAAFSWQLYKDEERTIIGKYEEPEWHEVRYEPTP